MSRILSAILAGCLVLTSCASRQESDRPGIVARSLRMVGFGRKKESPDQAVTRTKQLDLVMKLDPVPVRLADDRRINVRLSLANRSGKFVHMEFPTTQRFEILVRNEQGNVIHQWSEDRAFQKRPGLVAVNPNERIEYTTAIPTREMTAGTRYTIHAFFPDYEALKVEKTVTPLP
jgi:Intracellular proteinase inhibitor